MTTISPMIGTSTTALLAESAYTNTTGEQVTQADQMLGTAEMTIESIASDLSPEIFDENKLNRISGKSRDHTSAQSLGQYYQLSDNYANHQRMQVSFYSLLSGRLTSFKAFITTFNESYTSDWSEESVYGRMDPIMLFKNTQRRITLGLKVPCATISEGYENLARVGNLVKNLYPAYTNVNGATTIAQSPLVRMKVMNLAHSMGFSAYGADTAGANYKSFHTISEKDGLLGAITNVSIAHNLENPDAGVLEVAPGVILPKLIELSIDFVALHEHALGWSDQASPLFAGGSDGAAFPYGLDLDSSVNPAAKQGDANQGPAESQPGTDATGLPAPQLSEATRDPADAIWNRDTQGLTDNRSASSSRLQEAILNTSVGRSIVARSSARRATREGSGAMSNMDGAITGDQISPSISDSESTSWFERDFIGGT